MTRLTDDMIRNIPASMRAYESDLAARFGLDCVGVAALAAGLSRDKAKREASRLTAAVVPVTAGLGVIGTFAGVVAAIVRAAGVEAFVTERTDVDGLYEAHQRRADLVFMADDARYIALRLSDGAVADNNVCTSRGFARLLNRASAVKNRRVAVLGCGIIGLGAADEISALGAEIVMYDIDSARLGKSPYGRMGDIAELRGFELVFDATNTGGWLAPNMLSPAAWTAAPGVPLSFTKEALALHGARLIHDDLETGTLAMLGALLDA